MLGAERWIRNDWGWVAIAQQKKMADRLGENEHCFNSECEGEF